MRDMERRRLRGWILRILGQEYPAPLELTSLWVSLRSLFGGATSRDVQVEVAYLAEKGYVTSTTEKIADESIDMVRLSAAGKDVLEGHASDPGVAARTVG